MKGFEREAIAEVHREEICPTGDKPIQQEADCRIGKTVGEGIILHNNKVKDWYNWTSGRPSGVGNPYRKIVDGREHTQKALQRWRRKCLTICDYAILYKRYNRVSSAHSRNRTTVTAGHSTVLLWCCETRFQGQRAGKLARKHWRCEGRSLH